MGERKTQSIRCEKRGRKDKREMNEGGVSEHECESVCVYVHIYVCDYVCVCVWRKKSGREVDLCCCFFLSFFLEVYISLIHTQTITNDNIVAQDPSTATLETVLVSTPT